MADNHFDLVIVWDNLGGAVRVNAGGKATVTDPATGDLVTVVQDGQSVSTITADVNGRVSFVAQQGTVKLIAGGLAMIAVSAEQATAGAENAAAAQAAQVATEAARDDVVTGLAAKLDKTTADTLYIGQDPRGKIAPASVQDQGSSALRTFKAALAATRTGEACDILVIGDSITEGTGPATVEGRWASRFRDDLRAKYGITGGRGYVPSQYGINPPPVSQPWAYGGGATFPTGAYGLGKRIVRLNSSGNTATLTTPVGTTDVDVFITCSTAVVSWFSYTIDGVEGTDPASPVNVQALSSSTLRDVVIPLATGLDPSTTHTIVLTWAVGNVYLTGAMLYGGDKTTGIRLWDGARHGKDSLYFANLAEEWHRTMNTIQPDLVTIELGTNDWSAKSQTPAQMRANIETLIGSVRAQCTIPPSIVLIPVYERLGPGSPLAPWSEYVAAQKALAADDGDVAVLDLDKRIGVINSTATNGLGLLVADLVHPTDKGSQMITDALMDFVSYPIPA